MLQSIFEKLSIIWVSLIVLSCACSLHATTNIQEELENTSNNKPSLATIVSQTELNEKVELQIANNATQSNQTNAIEPNAGSLDDGVPNHQTKTVHPTMDLIEQWVQEAVNRHFKAIDKWELLKYRKIQWFDGCVEWVERSSLAFRISAALTGGVSVYLSSTSCNSDVPNILNAITTTLITTDVLLVQPTINFLRSRFSTNEKLIKREFAPIMSFLQAEHPHTYFDKELVNTSIAFAFKHNGETAVQ